MKYTPDIGARVTLTRIPDKDGNPIAGTVKTISKTSEEPPHDILVWVKTPAAEYCAYLKNVEPESFMTKALKKDAWDRPFRG